MSSRNYYCICDDGCKFPSMTKEQIYTLLDETLASGQLPTDYQSGGFVTQIKEQNKNIALKLWYGTQAEYNALQTKANDTYYIITDDSNIVDIKRAVETLSNKIEQISNGISETITELRNDIANNRENKILWQDGIYVGIPASPVVVVNSTLANALVNYDLISATIHCSTKYINYASILFHRVDLDVSSTGGWEYFDGYVKSISSENTAAYDEFIISLGYNVSNGQIKLVGIVNGDTEGKGIGDFYIFNIKGIK